MAVQRGSLPTAGVARSVLGGVALAGFMGVGKSTVGPLVAARLGLRWWDLDHRIEQNAGATISEIFRERGEPEFRRLELEAFRTGLAEGTAVISLGGGALLTPAARGLLADAALCCVVLQASWETISHRLRGSRRPLAHEAKPLFEARRAHYRALGTAVSTDRRTPEEVADAVVMVVQQWV
ncbi:MAG: shikimate kinase [Deltaproteobacteria bacterium]|nr:shikimate kinase [Deltaproteobacteria bacterium]